MLSRKNLDEPEDLIKGTHYPILYGSQMTCIINMKSTQSPFFILIKKHCVVPKNKSRKKVTIFRPQWEKDGLYAEKVYFTDKSILYMFSRKKVFSIIKKCLLHPLFPLFGPEKVHFSATF